MRFLIIVKANPEYEAGALPDAGLIARMTRFHEELARAGALLDGAGLWPSAEGWRVRYGAQGCELVPGPFAQVEQLVAGYTLIQARSVEDALAWSQRFPNPRGEGLVAEIEVRPLRGLDDFPPSAAIARLRELGATT